MAHWPARKDQNQNPQKAPEQFRTRAARHPACSVTWVQGRSQVFIGGGQAGGNVKFVNKTLQQNINPENCFIVNSLNFKKFSNFLNKYYHNF